MTYKALDLALPTVHLNGTAKQDLLDGFTSALDAVRDAVEALQKTSPNGRDFYVNAPTETGEAAIYKAAREHQARLHKLADIIRELNALALHVSDQ